MPKIEVNGINFHYWRVGQGPDVVMLHGLSGNLAVWHLKIVPELRANYRITTFDMRGHGKSDMPPTGYTTRDMADDLRGIMDALDIQYAHMVGHSLGTDVALHFSLMHPDRVGKIVAIEAGVAALVEERKREDWPGWEYWAKMLERYGGVKVPREKWHDFDYMIRQSVNVPVFYGPARGRQRKVDQLFKLLDTTTVVEDYQNSAGMTVEAMSTIRHPVMLVYGDNSQYMGTYDVLNDTLPNCKSVLLSDAEHFGPLEQPQELLKHMRAFLGNGELTKR